MARQIMLAVLTMGGRPSHGLAGEIAADADVVEAPEDKSVGHSQKDIHTALLLAGGKDHDFAIVRGGVRPCAVLRVHDAQMNLPLSIGNRSRPCLHRRQRRR